MSGPGKIEIYQQTSQAVAALLYNFDVASSRLKTEHVAWLDATMTPLVTRRGGNLVIHTIGLASRTGTDGFNLQLSKARGASVQSRISRLNPSILWDTSEIYVGERAARLIGIRDGVENERWRSVYVNAHEEKIPKYVQTFAPTFAKRRSRVMILLKEQMNTVGNGEPGEKAYQAAQAIRGVHGLAENIMHEEKVEVDERFEVLRVTTSHSDSSHGVPIFAQYDIDYLWVSYKWGPYGILPAGQRPKREIVINPDPRTPARNRQVVRREMGDIEAENWLTRPRWAYHHYQ